MNLFAPTLVNEYLTLNAKRLPQKEALIVGSQRWTYQTLDEYADELAQTLRNSAVKRQERVVVFLDNSAEAVISLYGILRAGAIFIILTGSIKGPKLAYIMRNCGAVLLITDTSKTRVVLDAQKQLEKPCETLWVGPSARIPTEPNFHSISWDSIFSRSGRQDQPRATTRPEPAISPCIDVDLAALIYTSGSTGQPKGVMSTHHNMISAARSIIQYVGNVEQDIILSVLPLSFDYGLYQVIMAFMFGGTVVLEKSFIYLHKVLECIGREKVTGFPIVPTVLAMLLKMQDLHKYDFSSLRYVTNTGAALPVEHIRRFRSLFPHVQLISMFGLTECKRVCYLPPDELDRRPGSVGKAMPNCEVLIVDEHGYEVAAGQVGELIIRGSNVMQGYWNDPELTARTYRPGRYPAERILHSGDFFRKDEEGFLYFLGRKDDMIKCRGERVSAKEVENVICELQGVVEAAVIGVPDEILGQAIKAFVVPAPGTKLTQQGILKHCAQRLENFSTPKYVEIRDSLPKSPHGKIDKKLLKNNQ